MAAGRFAGVGNPRPDDLGFALCEEGNRLPRCRGSHFDPAIHSVELEPSGAELAQLAAG